MFEVKDFPKLESPFSRELINNNFILTSKFNSDYKWIFDKEKVIASEKLDGTNVSVIVEKGKVIGIYNRKNKIEILSNKKDFRFIEGINHSIYKERFRTNKSGQFFGELIGPSIQKNAYKEEKNIWIPFSYLLEKCSYKFWFKFIEENIENNKFDEKNIFNKINDIFKDLWSLYYRRKTGDKIFAEGIVFHNKETGKMCKLRRDMFSWYKGDSHDFYKTKMS